VCDNSLKRLRLERIDLYQLHRVESEVPMEDSLGALKEMPRGAGKIPACRAWSEVGPQEIESRLRARLCPSRRCRNLTTLLTASGTTRWALREKRAWIYAVVHRSGGGRSLKGSAIEGCRKRAERERVSAGDRLAAASLTCDAADSGHVVGRANLEENVAAVSCG